MVSPSSTNPPVLSHSWTDVERNISVNVLHNESKQAQYLVRQFSPWSITAEPKKDVWRNFSRFDFSYIPERKKLLYLISFYSMLHCFIPRQGMGLRSTKVGSQGLRYISSIAELEIQVLSFDMVFLERSGKSGWFVEYVSILRSMQSLWTWIAWKKSFREFKEAGNVYKLG
jgi:hypothetical protein